MLAIIFPKHTFHPRFCVAPLNFCHVPLPLFRRHHRRQYEQPRCRLASNVKSHFHTWSIMKVVQAADCLPEFGAFTPFRLETANNKNRKVSAKGRFDTLMRLSKPGVDPASKVSGGAISVIFGSQVSLRAHYCKRDEVYFTTLLWKTMEGKMALYRESYFSNCTNSWWIKLLSWVLGRAIASIAPSGSEPAWNSRSAI